MECIDKLKFELRTMPRKKLFLFGILYGIDIGILLFAMIYAVFYYA